MVLHLGGIGLCFFCRKLAQEMFASRISLGASVCTTSEGSSSGPREETHDIRSEQKTSSAPKLSVVPRPLCCSTQLVEIWKCNLTRSKFTGIFLNCIKEKGFGYKGFRHRMGTVILLLNRQKVIGLLVYFFCDFSCDLLQARRSLPKEITK